ncbi:MAG: sulfatase-like hydrolase/transferase [Phycisphaera sp.]|nr:sulfatase-like hydrolase/transferase [Phycisphaera sp.]
MTRILTHVTAWALLLTLLIAATARAADRPNFVVIMADDLGYGDLSCYDGWINTPNIDGLAREGLRFTDFHSSGPVCSPTRAGLMTGRYQQRAGVPGVVFADPKRPQHEDGLQTSETTFAELLKRAGYATGMFGKWHLGYTPNYNPIHHGFDEFVGYVSGNVDFFSHVDQAGEEDWWHGDKLTPEEGYTTHLITKHALDFLERHKDGPFCLYLPYEPPHYPYQGPNDKAFREVGKADVHEKQSKEEIRQRYSEMVVEMDKGVGEIIARLKQYGIEGNTLVLFFSDNGATPNGSVGPLRGNKGSVWEGGHRIPFIAWWPGRIEAGGTTSQMGITLDVMPTLLSLAKVDAKLDRPLDGVDLSKVLLERASLGERQLYWEFSGQQAMRDGPWKLVRNTKGSKGTTLYKLTEDLGEEKDVASANAERFERMQAELDAWNKDVHTDATPQPSDKK